MELCQSTIKVLPIYFWITPRIPLGLCRSGAVCFTKTHLLPHLEMRAVIKLFKKTTLNRFVAHGTFGHGIGSGDVRYFTSIEFDVFNQGIDFGGVGSRAN